MTPPGSGSDAFISIRGVSKQFGPVRAVEELNFDIGRGEFFSLLGPSGCGKTTTLRMIAGLEYPTEGSIKIFGEEMGIRPPNKRPVNTVFQSYALFPHMTIADNVGFGLAMRKVDKAEARRLVGEAIDLVRLTGMEKRKPKQLSGGQQQRVALARALVNRPKVLLLDEPLGALDFKLRAAMQLELKEIQREVGITFVFVTHDQEEALTMSDRIGVMNDGELLQVGPSEEIYERPTSRFVADFIGDTNFLEATVEGQGEVRLTNGAMIRARTHSGPGSRVTVSLRPEKLHLYTDRSEVKDGYNAVDARVIRRLYFGDSLYYELDMGVGSVVDARVENIPGLRRCEVDEAVVVSFHPEAAEALTE
ncbi:MAG: ABC transporter ATP-binding protein [Actinobacteria bacterium]|nr:MAG: ABC transporter ATP-binding protein [Actinomycetota bacterium]